MAKKQKITRLNIKIRIAILLAICMIVCISFAFEHQIERVINYKYNPTISSDVGTSELKIHFIDVGQGDAIAIKLPDGKNVLVDAGPKSASEQLVNYLNNSFFETNDKVFDYLILTHAHEDHIGGAPAVLQNFEIKHAFRPTQYSKDEIQDRGDWDEVTTNIYNDTIKSLENEMCNGVTCLMDYNSSAKEIIGSEYKIDFLSPNVLSYENTNNYSPILMLSYDNRKVILTGDAETLVEQEVMTSYVGSLKADVLKLGHHGSSTSTSNEFLEVVDPDFVVISCGAGNKYRHPNQSTLNKLSENNIGDDRIFRTDLAGNIVFGIKNNESGDGIVSCSVNYTNQIAVFIEYNYVAGVIIIVSVCILFIPKFSKKDIKKLLKDLKK